MPNTTKIATAMSAGTLVESLTGEPTRPAPDQNPRPRASSASQPPTAERTARGIQERQRDGRVHPLLHGQSLLKEDQHHEQHPGHYREACDRHLATIGYEPYEVSGPNAGDSGDDVTLDLPETKVKETSSAPSNTPSREASSNRRPC